MTIRIPLLEEIVRHAIQERYVNNILM